ncbi:hypothetical protein OF83DRAFT_790925 [Amylostereum chailletii]|nr:hypothetical protein OF83DRAFT_790925 [Amylostereum chailletii]
MSVALVSSAKRPASQRSSIDNMPTRPLPTSPSSALPIVAFPPVPPLKRQRTDPGSNSFQNDPSALSLMSQDEPTCSRSPTSDVPDTASMDSGSDEEWSYEETCKYFAVPDMRQSSTDEGRVTAPSDSPIFGPTPIESLSSIPDMSSLCLDAEPLEDSQCLSKIAPTLSVSRSLPRLEMPSIVWSNTSFTEFESHEFTNTVCIRPQRVPATIVDPGEPWYPVQRSNFLGVEELILVLPTSTMNMIETNNRLKLEPKIWLSEAQIHAGVQFLTEALLSAPGEEAYKKHVTRWGGMKSSALVLGTEGLEREVMAVVVSFLASVDDDDTTQINIELEGKDDLRAEWKGLLKPEDLKRLEKIAKHWREASLLS